MEQLKNIIIKYREIISYLIVGFLTTLVSLVTYYICTSTFLNPDNPLQLQIANIISWICAVIFAFFTNKKYVFKTASKSSKKEFISFISSRIFTLLLDMLIMFIMVTVLSLNDKIAKLVVQVIVTILNYLLSKLFVFKSK